MAKVSVIIPTYNEREMLIEAVESVLSSTFTDTEIIVVNDGSEDTETLTVLNTLEKNHRAKVLHQSNQGVSSARNAGIAISSGDYLMMLDADDRLQPQYIQKAVDVLEQHPEIDICYAEASFFGKREGVWQLPPFSVAQMLEENVVYVTSLIRRKVFLAIGGFDEEIIYGCQDYNFYLSCIERGYSFYRIPEQLFLYRIKDVSMTTSLMTNIDQMLSVRETLYDKHCDLFVRNGVGRMDFIKKAVKDFAEQQKIMLRAANQNTEEVKKQLEQAVAQWANVDYELQQAKAHYSNLQKIDEKLSAISQQQNAWEQQAERLIQQNESSQQQLAAERENRAALEASIVQQKSVLECSRQELTDEKEKCVLLERAYAQQSDMLSDYREQLSEQREKNELLDDKIAEQKQALDLSIKRQQEQKEYLASLNMEIARQKKEYEELLHKNEELKSAHDYVVGEWTACADTISVLKCDLTDQRNRIQLMDHSISWKITKPLRAGKRIAKKTVAKSVLGAAYAAKRVLRRPKKAKLSPKTIQHDQWPPKINEVAKEDQAVALNSKSIKRLIIFTFYDQDQQVDDYIVYLLRSLMPYAERLVIMVNGELPEKEKKKLQIGNIEVYTRKNEGLDAWAERDALLLVGLKQLEEYDEVLIANGTIMGPVCSLDAMFEEMDKRKLDFWGLLSHKGMAGDPFGCNPYGTIPEHIQSFFFAFRKRVIKSQCFKAFWKQLPRISNYNESVGLYETVFTRYFADHGFVWGTYMDAESYYPISENPLIDIPVESIRQFGCPFFKRRVFFQDYDYYSTYTGQHTALQLMDYIREETKYPVEYIMKNLIRTTHMCDLVQDLHLSKVLDASQCFGKKQKAMFAQMRVATFVHLFDMSMLPIIKKYLANLPKEVDLFISTTSAEKEENIRQAFADLPNRCTVKVCPNRGRDVSALLTTFKPYVSQYDVICVTHDKKTGYLKPGTVGEGFAYMGYENLMSSQAYVINVLNAFLDDLFLGMLYTPDPNHADFGTHIGLEWGENYAATKRLHDELGLHAPISEKKPPCAPFGSNFWIRTKALAPLYNKNWTYDDFPEEPFKMVDGSILHAVERIYPYCAQEAGYYSALVMTTDYAAIELGNMQFNAQQFTHVAFDHGIANRFIVVRDVLNQRLSQSDIIQAQPDGSQSAALTVRRSVKYRLKRRVASAARRVIRKMEQWNRE